MAVMTVLAVLFFILFVAALLFLVLTSRKMKAGLKQTDVSEFEVMKNILMTRIMDVISWEIDIPADGVFKRDTETIYSQDYRRYFGFEDENDFPNVLGSWSTRIHPDDKEKVVAAFYAHINDRSGNTPCDLEYRFLRKDGEYKYVHSVCRTIRGEGGKPVKTVGIKEDITEKKRMEAEIDNNQKMLAEANRLKQISINSLESILNSIDAFIYVTVPETGEILFANKQIKKLFGDENDNIIGKFCYKSRGLDKMCDFCPCYKLNENPDQTVVWEEYDELHNKYILHSDCYIDWHNGEKVHLQHAVDITELIHAKKSAERSSRYKTDFLARMSHEIRTPMNAIIGMTELALRETEPGAKNVHIYTVKQAGSNLLAIINDILDFSKIEAGKMEIIPEEYSVASLINDVVSIIRMRVVESHLRFAVKVDSNIPSVLYGDEVRIRQAVLNILNNAIKYTEEGFVSFGVYGEFINDSMVKLIFEVTDSGIGIKPEDMEKLFTDFTQLDSGKNRGIEGVGLGLAITHSIVKAIGGHINVQSSYGEGSTFTVTLPQKYFSREAMAKVDKKENKSVLIYERRNIYKEALFYAVENLGINCTLVSSGTDLYEKMESQIYDYLFISFTLFRKNKDTILKFGQNTETIILSEFGEAIPEKYLNVLAMPVYCTQIADMFNKIHSSQSYTVNKEIIVRFCAPDAKVLIVDDININLKVAEGLLAPYNMQIDLCSNGASAIEAVQSGHYDLVFMDHKMPGMDGIETTKRIREWEKKSNNFHSSLPVIALTANAVSGMMEMFLENGFNDFLSKPIDTVQLNTILEKWIPKNKQKRK